VKTFLNDESKFVLKDGDGVMAVGEIPKLIDDEGVRCQREADRVHYVRVNAMTSEEREAYETLLERWKSANASNSAFGSEHRRVTGGLNPDGQRAIAAKKCSSETQVHLKHQDHKGDARKLIGTMKEKMLEAQALLESLEGF
jgi:hypothetical protein